jgi:hypothetical protein
MIRESCHALSIPRHHLRCPNGIQIIYINVGTARPFDAKYPRLTGTAISRRYNGVGACCDLSALKPESRPQKKSWREVGETYWYCSY